MSYLTLFTIGPVQSFIAQARKFQDLYAGSFLLSHLTEKTMDKAKSMGAEILFPKPHPEQKSLPNRFLMKIDAKDEKDLRNKCEKLKDFVRKELHEIAKTAIENSQLKYSGVADVENQIELLLQVYYASEEYIAGKEFGNCYINVIKRLGSAKTLRLFEQIDEEPGRKCALSYESNALFYRSDDKKERYVESAQPVPSWNDLDKYMQKNEAFGAVAFVKRCLKYAISDFDDNFPSVSHIACEAQLKSLKDKEPVLSGFINKIRMDPTLLFGEPELSDSKENDAAAEYTAAVLSALNRNKIKLSPYYAVVMFDGDDMGTWYSEPTIDDESKIEEFQSFLSEEISKFAAEKSRKIVDWKNKKNGAVIYAGGEDFLGALNLFEVFSALKELREEFGKINLSDYTTKPLTFSAGVVIAHIKMPMSEVLSLAREAESKAKKYKDKDKDADKGKVEDADKDADKKKDKDKKKDAFCLTIARHSGEKTEFVQPFYTNGKSSLKILESIISVMVCNKVSTKFLYQLGEELEQIAENRDKETQPELKKDIFLIEAKRILRNSDIPEKTKEEKEKIVSIIYDDLEELACMSEFDLKNLLQFLRGIAFIARERGAAR